MLKILIADDHPLYRTGLARLVSGLDDVVDVTEADSFGEECRLLRDEGPFDLVLTDLRMPGGNPAAEIQEVVSLAGKTPVVVVSGFETRQNVEGALEAGTRGFLPKSAQTSVMLSALKLVLLGEIYVPKSLIAQEYGGGLENDPASRADLAEMRGQLDILTQRQRAVLALIGQGLSNRDIAQRLSISEGTVKVHVGAILKTMGVSNRTQAALVATELGLTPEDNGAAATGT